MSYSFLYTTCATHDEAVQISHILVENKLIACANIFDNITSIYRWEDKVEQSNEVVLIAKTSKKHEAEITELVKHNHSYECPCIVFTEIHPGNNEFFAWIDNEVK